MAKKCLKKFERYDFERGINILELKTNILLLQKDYEDIMDEAYSKEIYIIKLRVVQ